VSSEHLEPQLLEVHGRSSATRYRCFFLRLPTVDQHFRARFLERRRALLAHGVPGHFLEALNVTLVPVSNIRQAVLNKEYNSTAADASSVSVDQALTVRDIDHRDVRVGSRTVKLLQAGALHILEALSRQSVRTPEYHSASLWDAFADSHTPPTRRMASASSPS